MLDGFELIIIDDGSTDETIKSVLTYTEIFNQRGISYQILHQDNSGKSVARVVGIQDAHGELATFIDGDDWIEPDHFSLLLQTQLENMADLTCSNYYVDETEQRKFSRIGLYGYHKILDQHMFLKLLLSDQIERFPWNKLFKKSFFRTIFFVA